MKPVRALLVDDSPTFLRIAARYLCETCRDEVAVIGTARGGEEALAQAQALQPQLVLLDLMMPRPSGLEVIPRLRALLPHVCIVALTLLDTSSYRRAALAAGADAFVAKATMETDLLPAVRQAMQTRGDAWEIPRGDQSPRYKTAPDDELGK
jgi:DNA-binding NarL/FixJ family response regulator